MSDPTMFDTTARLHQARLHAAHQHGLARPRRTRDRGSSSRPMIGLGGVRTAVRRRFQHPAPACGPVVATN